MIFKPEAKPKKQVLDENQRKYALRMIKEGTNKATLRKRFLKSEEAINTALQQMGFSFQTIGGKRFFVEEATGNKFEAVVKS